MLGVRRSRQGASMKCQICKGIGMTQGPPVERFGQKYPGPFTPCIACQQSKPQEIESDDAKNLRIEAAEWIATHPKAMELYLRFSLELARRGRHFGISLITERIRWECYIEKLDRDQYKISNNHRAYIARWLIERHPALANLIETRETKW
jgi:hypothetical protein